MELIDKIKDAGLKVTPQRKMIYEIMMQLRHATVDDIVLYAKSKGCDMTVSTVYRILDSFCKVNLLSYVSHPETGKSYYDINISEHGHIFSGTEIVDYDDSELINMIREYISKKNNVSGEIDKVHVQITVTNLKN